MEKICNLLKSKGHEVFYTEGNIAESYNKFLRITVMKADNKYTVRYALLIYFERWANSGFEKEFNTEDEALSFIENEKEMLISSISEIVRDTVDVAYWFKPVTRDRILEMFIEQLNDLAETNLEIKEK